jgi:selenocysteine lyase/cysteine desulfurase
VPGTPQRLVRISAQAYNTFAQYEYLLRALESELAAEG